MCSGQATEPPKSGETRTDDVGGVLKRANRAARLSVEGSKAALTLLAVGGVASAEKLTLLRLGELARAEAGVTVGALAFVDADLGSARGDTRMAQEGGIPKGPGSVGAASPVVETKGD